MVIETASRYATIQRLNGSQSQQPRFSKKPSNNLFASILRFITTDIQNEPDYGSRERDDWLRRVWKLEPYLSGVINSVVSIDKNRGWELIGGRNQVKRFVNVLHNRFYFAPDLLGWRMSFGGSASSYYTSDIGSITEIGRDGQNGPMDSLYFVDPARCSLTGDFDYPLSYRPANGNEQKWQPQDYFRVASLPDTDETEYGLGFCAVSRCIELAKIMVGIYQYDNEMLLNQAPRGLLLLKGMTQEQWQDALDAREARLAGDDNRYYGAVEVIADTGMELDAQLIALANLPAEFDQETFTNLLMLGYALAFGHPYTEFWHSIGGALGTATQAEVQHRKAGSKGALDFVLGFAEKLQEELPDTLQFEFSERDYDEELANAAAEQAQADVVTSLYESGLKEGKPLVGWEEGRILLAKKNIIDPEWTENEEETVATDTEDDISRLLQNERVQRAIWKYPNEPIVRYSFKVKNGREIHQYQTILKPTRKARTFYSFGRMVKRQAGIESELADYQEQMDALAQQANEGEISQDEFQEKLEALTIAILILSMLRGMDSESGAAQELEAAALSILAGGSIETGMAILTNAELLESVFPEDGLGALGEAVDGSLQSTLAVDIYTGNYIDNPEGLLGRLGMWGITAFGLYQLGRMIGNPARLFRWDLGPTLEHCSTCSGQNGQIKTGAEWQAGGVLPQTSVLECTGRRCLCMLNEVG